MKNIAALILIFAIGTISIVYAQLSPENVLKAVMTCYNDRDADCYVSHYTSRYATAKFGGMLKFKKSRQEQFDYMKAHPDRSQTFSIVILESAINSNSAEIQTMRTTTYQNGRKPMRLSEIWKLVKQDGVWLIDCQEWDPAITLSDRPQDCGGSPNHLRGQ